MFNKSNATIEVNNIRAKIKHYKKIFNEIEEYLSEHPNEWGRFQSEFNFEVDSVFREIMNFEKEELERGCDDKVYKLKQFFIKNIKGTFERGELTKWIIEKPYGYAGDYKIIEDVYRNNPVSDGVDRLFDNYVQMSAISMAVRNRKNDFKRMLINFVRKRKNEKIAIMDLASGPCREVIEVLNEEPELFRNVTFDCYDSDENSLAFSKERLKDFSCVNFIKENAARIAFRKDINALIDKKYDIIYSTGLFDYFEENIAMRLIGNLRKLLNNNGVLMISDVRDKYSNPSVHFMEWVGEWELVYRNDDDFRKLFVDVGFSKDDLEMQYEQQGILQYILATFK